MKLMLRPEWRLWPLSSFLGLLDLKTGVTVALLFALLNKVAGVYGLIAVLTGAGGSFAQLSLYIYSVIALLALGWGLKAVKEEDPKHTLYFAHLFFADHIFSTSWTIFFAVIWWVYTPHDGRRQANSAAQEDMMKGGVTGTGSYAMTDEERIEAAMMIWNHEKGTAAAVIVVSWLSKIYFALLIYSYASHLRKGSYRSLPHSRPSSSHPTNSAGHVYDTSILDEDEEEIEDFYRVPLRSPKTGDSITTFADFIGAPGRSRKSKPLSFGRSEVGKPVTDRSDADIEEEVLFDEDELSYASSSRGHSKLGTEESSTSVSTDDERTTSVIAESGRGEGRSRT